MAHSNALPLKLCVHPSIFVDESRFGALPTLVQTELIHSFLAKHTGLSVSYAMVKRVLGFHGLGWVGRERPRESVTVRSLSLSNDWELTTDGERLVVRARKSQPSARSTAAKSDFQENQKDLASVFNLGTEGWTMEVTGKNDASDSGLDPLPTVTGRITVTHPKVELALIWIYRYVFEDDNSVVQRSVSNRCFVVPYQCSQWLYFNKTLF